MINSLRLCELGDFDGAHVYVVHFERPERSGKRPEQLVEAVAVRAAEAPLDHTAALFRATALPDDLATHVARSLRLSLDTATLVVAAMRAPQPGTIPCGTCKQPAGLDPPTKREGHEIVCLYRCPEGHVTERRIALK